MNTQKTPIPLLETKDEIRQRLNRFVMCLRAQNQAIKLARKKQFVELQAFFDKVCPPTKKQLNQRKIRNIVIRNGNCI